MSVQMTDLQKPPPRSLRVVRLLFHIYLRLLAIIFFAAAIYAWMQAIGFWDGDNYRFDTMGMALRIYTAVMVVMLPVASVGLWTTLPWGRVIWFFAVAFQSVSMIRFPDLFAMPAMVLLFHFCCLAIYVVFQLLLLVIAKKE